MAVLNRHVSVAEILLKAGVQVDYMNAKKASALHLAVQQGDIIVLGDRKSVYCYNLLVTNL